MSDEKRSTSEKLDAAGKSMQDAGKNVMGCGCAVFVLAFLAFLAYVLLS